MRSWPPPENSVSASSPLGEERHCACCWETLPLLQPAPPPSTPSAPYEMISPNSAHLFGSLCLEHLPLLPFPPQPRLSRTASGSDAEDRVPSTPPSSFSTFSPGLWL